MGKTPKTAQWLNAINKILKREQISVAEFARQLGGLKGESGYIQVYRWLVARSVKPGGEITIRLIAWAVRKDPKLIQLLDPSLECAPRH